MIAASEAKDPVLLGDVMGEVKSEDEGVAKLSAEAESARLAKAWSIGDARAFVGDDRARAGWGCPALGLAPAKMVPEPCRRVIG